MNNTALKLKDQRPAKQWSAGLYLRLSREDGDKYESESISSQRDLLLDFINRNPDITVYDTYEDDGWTGTNFNRPNFKRMEDDLRAKKIDCIIVKDLSRFARNCIEIGNYLSIVFPYLKTRFICINDNVDSYIDPESLDNLSTKFKNLINDEYCRDISIKVKSSLTIRRESGDFIGSFPSYGYQRDPSDYHKLIIDEEPAEVVKRIYGSFISGNSIRGIVRELNQANILPPVLYKKKKYPTYNPANVKSDTMWTQRMVRRILTNQMYVGDMVQNVMNNISYRIQKCRSVEEEKRIIVPNTHEPIIGRDDFQKVKDLLSRDTYESPKTHQLYVLAGFVKCGDCKRGMIRKNLYNGWKEYHYLLCSTYKNKSKTACTKHNINADKVEEAVLTFIKKNIAFALEVEPILEMIKNSPLRKKRSERFYLLKQQYIDELTKFQKLREELYPDYKAGLIDRTEYETFKNRYEIKIADLENHIRDMSDKIAEIETGLSPENNFIVNFKKYRSITELTREVVSALIENVYIYEDERIEIVMKYNDDFETLLEYIDTNRLIITQVAKQQLDKYVASGIIAGKTKGVV